MTTKIRLALCALTLAAPGWTTLRAADPAPAPKTARVLILDNERTLEGDIERQGEQYRIRRTFGELWIPRENVLRLCDSREEAYAYLRSRANLRDPDEHLRLAQWCHLHGLRGRALEEVTEAVALRPNHVPSRRLLRSLQQAAVEAPTTSAARPPAEVDAGQNPLQVNTESLTLFVTRVQPILMNACASCHAAGRGGAFRLVRAYESALANRRTTQQNLAAVLAQVNKERPQASLLLTRALSVHGRDMDKPALKGRDAAAYKALEDWVRVTVESNPELREHPAGPPGSGERPGTAEPAAADAAPAHPPAPNTSAATALPAWAEARQSETPAANASSKEPVDPFDPVIFNRQMHPHKAEDKKP